MFSIDLSIPQTAIVPTNSNRSSLPRSKAAEVPRPLLNVRSPINPKTKSVYNLESSTNQDLTKPRSQTLAPLRSDSQSHQHDYKRHLEYASAIFQETPVLSQHPNDSRLQ